MKEIDRKAMIRMSIVFKGLSIIETPASGRFRDKTSDPYPHKKRNPGFLHEMPGLRDEVRFWLLLREGISVLEYLHCDVLFNAPPAISHPDRDIKLKVSVNTRAIVLIGEETKLTSLPG